jgi:hypothetical protein
VSRGKDKADDDCGSIGAGTGSKWACMFNKLSKKLSKKGFDANGFSAPEHYILWCRVSRAPIRGGGGSPVKHSDLNFFHPNGIQSSDLASIESGLPFGSKRIPYLKIQVF